MNLLTRFFITSTLAFFLLLSGASLANDSDITAETEAQIKQIISAEKRGDDKFHEIMEDMWGGFIFTDSESGSKEPTLLAEVVGYTNVLALVLGIIIVTYVSLAAVVNSAQSGEVMGKQMNSYWWPIRTAAAFGLLVPTQVGAYALSTAQVMVIKLIIMASTSASFLWSNAVDTAFVLKDPKPLVTLPYKLGYETSVALACTTTISREANWKSPNAITFTYREKAGGLNANIADTIGNPNEYMRGGYFYTKTAITESTAENISSLASALSAQGSNINPKKGRFLTEINFWGGGCGNLKFNIPSFSTAEDSRALSDNSSLKQTSNNHIATVNKSKDSLAEYQKAYLNFMVNYVETVIREKGEPITMQEKFEMISLPISNQPSPSFERLATQYVNIITDEEDTIKIKAVDAVVRGTGSLRSVDSTSFTSTDAHLYLQTWAYRKAMDEFIKKIRTLYKNVGNEQIKDADKKNKELSDSLKEGGWLYAGSFFYKISQLENLASATARGMQNTSSGSTGMECNSCAEEESLKDATELVAFMYEHSYINPLSSITNDESVEKASLESKVVSLKSALRTNPSVDDTLVSELVSAHFVELMADIGEDGTDGENLTDGSLGAVAENNPFQFAANIGHGMNNVRYVLYAAKAAAMTFLHTIEYAQSGVTGTIAGMFGAGVATSGTSGFFTAITTMVIELITISLTILTAMAWTLAYYIPMMPALLWITLIGAYLLICIEAVVATPLAVVLMATPEGEGISGTKMQNAITLLASVYLRPSLMVIGLIAAVYIAKYSFMILNEIFWAQAESATRGDLFGFFAVFTLYIISLHQILSNSIKAIDSLPTAILNWIGQGANAQFGQNEISGASEQLGAKEQGLGNAGSQFQDTFKGKAAKANFKSALKGDDKEDSDKSK